MKKPHFKLVLVVLSLIVFSVVVLSSSVFAQNPRVFAQSPNGDINLEFDVVTYDVATGDVVTTATQEIGQVLLIRNFNDQTVTYSNIETSINAITLDSLTGQNVPVTVNPLFPGANEILSFSKISARVGTLSVGAPLSKGKYVLKNKFLVRDFFIGGAPVNKHVYVEQVFDVAEAMSVDAAYDLIQNVNWDNIQELSVTGVNWQDLKVQSLTAVNWADVRSLSKAGVNWVDLRKQSISGMNWDNLKEMTKSGINYADIKIQSISGVNWVDFRNQTKAGVNWNDLKYMTTSGINWAAY